MTIFVPKDDFDFSEKLKEEVGGLKYPVFYVIDDNYRWFHSDCKSSEMAIRGIIRQATLRRKLGFNAEEWDSPMKHSPPTGYAILRDVRNIETFRGPVTSLENYNAIKVMMQEPVYQGYDWQTICIWNLGNYKDLESQVLDKSLAIVDVGVFLFVDEVKELSKGGTVITKDMVGFGNKFLKEEKETFKVVDGDLLRVYTRYID